jgi:hypothetical protein
MARYTKTGTPNTIGQINAELDLIALAINDTLSRVGDSPNQLETALDINSNRILNPLAQPLSNNTITYVTSLVSLAAIPIGQASVYLDLGGRSGFFKYDSTVSAGTIALDTRQAVYVASDFGGAWVRSDMEGQASFNYFGAVADYNKSAGTGTDNQVALAAAEILCETLGLSLLFEGNYGVGSSTVHKSIKHFGVMKGTSGLFALNDGHRIYTWSAADTTGNALFKDLTLHGYADRNATLGSDDDAIIEVSPIESVLFDGVEFAYSRQMSVKSRARKSTARDCYVNHSHRDGINFTDSQIRIVTNNTIEYCADDAIACHSNSSNFLKTETVITGNVLFNSLGIKCLCSNFTIVGNRGNMIFGYGVQYGKASGFTEGDIDVKACTVANNNFNNIINTDKLGLGDLGAGIFSKPIFTPNTNSVYPNDYDRTANVFVDPLTNINTYGAAVSHIGNLGVSITGNNFIQTWTGGTTISDYGFGQAWTTAGFVDIALTGTLGKDGNKVETYRFEDSAENVICEAGVTYGTSNVYAFNNCKRLRNFNGSMGNASRIYLRAIVIAKDSSLTNLHCINAFIKGGSLDMDPLHEHPDRTIVVGEPTGGWDNTTSNNCVGLEALNVRGFTWENTYIKNIQRILKASGGGVITPVIKNLTAYHQGSGIGIGVVNNEYDHNNVYTDSDPRSTTFGEILQGNLSARGTVPTTDYYFAGQRIKNSDLTATLGGSKYSELIRTTTSNAHVVGTDWGYIPFT